MERIRSERNRVNSVELLTTQVTNVHIICLYVKSLTAKQKSLSHNWKSSLFINII